MHWIDLFFIVALAFPLWLVWFGCSLYTNGETLKTVGLFAVVLIALYLIAPYLEPLSACGYVNGKWQSGPCEDGLDDWGRP